MDEDSINLFRKALQEGTYKCYNIRLIIIGHYGAGKTTLAKRLIGEDFDMKTVKSTNGIDIFIINCTIEPDGSWTIEKDRNVQMLDIERMANTLKVFTTPRQQIPLKNSNTEPHMTDQAIYLTSSNVADLLTTKTESTVYKQQKEDIENFQAEEVPDHVAEEASSLDLPGPCHSSVSQNIIDMADHDVTHENVTEPNFEDSIKQSEEFEIAETLKKVLHVYDIPSTKQTARLSIWDFAGQAMFYTTHLAFLSRRAQYLLVTDVSRSLNDIVEDDDFSSIGGNKKMAIADFVKFWINTIHSIASSNPKGTPKVFLAATHKDRLKYIPEINSTVIFEHFKSIRHLFDNNPAKRHLFEEDFCIDCTNSHDQAIPYLRKKIFDEAVQEYHWGEEIPSSWMFMEKQLRKEKQDGVRVITVQEVRSMNKRLAVKINDDEEIIVFLRFQHAVGEILFYNQEKIKEFVILDPQWLIDSFKCIITAKDFIDKSNLALCNFWKDLFDNAILRPELIEVVWKKHKECNFMHHREALVLLLIHTNIIANPKAYDGLGKEKEEKFYLVPCMLKEVSSELVERLLETSSVMVKPLWFVFCHDFLPPAIFFRLLACCVARFPVAKFQKSKFIYTKAAIFRLSSEHYFLLEHYQNAIQLQIIGYEDLIGNALLCGIKKFIEETLSELSEIYRSDDEKSANQSSFILAMQCCERCKPFLNTKQYLVCEKSVMPHEFELSVFKNEWIDAERGELVHLPDLMHNDEAELEENCLDMKPTYQELGRIARRVGKEIYMLGILLGLQKYQIDQLQITFSDYAVDVNFQILKKWMLMEAPESCNFTTLQRAMLKANIDVSFLSTVQHISTRAAIGGEKFFPERCPWTIVIFPGGTTDLPNAFLEMIPSDEQIDLIALHVGTEYQQLAIELGLLPERLDRIKMDKHKTLDRVVQILKDWRDGQSINATFFHLCNAMFEVAMDLSALKVLARTR